MRTTSLIFACAMLFLGPSIAGTADTGLPGVGTFEFSGFASFASDAPMLMAAVR